MKFEMSVTNAHRAFGAMSKGSCQDASRPHLSGVFVRTSGRKYNLVATDGHVMLLWVAKIERDEKELPDGSFHLTTEAVTQILDELKIIARRWKIQVGSMSVVFDTKKKVYTHELGTMKMDLIETEDFPPYDRIIPPERTTGTAAPGFVGVGPTVFINVFKAFKKGAVNRGDPELCFEVGETPLSPVLITSPSPGGCPEMTAVVMPVKLGSEPSFVPFIRTEGIIKRQPSKT